MTATIVPFARKVPKKKSSLINGMDLPLPTEEDLKGFINTMNFLAMQSDTQAVNIDLMADELTLSIQHHDDFTDGEVLSASSLELMANIEFAPANPTKMVADLLVAFDRLNLDNYDDGTKDENKSE